MTETQTWSLTFSNSISITNDDSFPSLVFENVTHVVSVIMKYQQCTVLKWWKFFINRVFSFLVSYIPVIILIWEYQRKMSWEVKKEMYLFLYKPWTLYFQYEFSCGNIRKDFFGSVHWNIDRSNCPQMFFKIVTLENFIIFTGKHLCFSVSIAKLLRTAFLWNTSGGCSGCFCTEAVLLQNRLGVLTNFIKFTGKHLFRSLFCE